MGRGVGYNRPSGLGLGTPLRILLHLPPPLIFGWRRGRVTSVLLCVTGRGRCVAQGCSPLQVVNPWP